jgi:hypothetical protein
MSSNTPQRRQRKVTGNFAAMLTLVAISLLLVGSGFYGPHWSFDYSTLSYEVRDTILKIERFAEKDVIQPVSQDVIDAQRYRQKWVQANATRAELQALLDYPHAGIKLTAYLALLDCHEIDHYALLQRALSRDAAEILFMPSPASAQAVDSQYTTIGSYLVDYVTSELPINCNLTEAQILDLASFRNRLTPH